MRRQERVSSLLSEELAKLIENTLDQKYGIVTLTRVELQPDLKMAKVFVSCLEKSVKDDVIKKLSSKTIQYQHILGKRLKMRYTPKLFFYIDESQEDVENIVNLMEKINQGKSNNK